jgi:hypothetical protein
MGTLTTLYSETRQLQLTLALLLADGFTGGSELLGTVTVTAETGPVGLQKSPYGTYLFFGLAAGLHTLQVRSLEGYYQPVDIPLVVPLPSPLWPAYPDRSIANPTIPLDDPAQPAAYRAQRELATLMPTAQYPFPAGATLVRGTVTHLGAPLSGALVDQAGGLQVYITASDGQYVLFFTQTSGIAQTVTLRATHAALPDANVPVDLARGTTVSQNIAM